MKKVKRKQRNFPSTTTEDGEQKVQEDRYDESRIHWVG